MVKNRISYSEAPNAHKAQFYDLSGEE